MKTRHCTAIFFVQLLATPYFYYTRNHLNIRWQEIKRAITFDPAVEANNFSRLAQSPVFYPIYSTEKPPRKKTLFMKTSMVSP